ncbi:winged helix-turn-helix transcriptional regulator, partial [Dyadobacter jiangsuensis]
CMEGPELTCLQKCYWPKTDSPTIKSEEEPNFTEFSTVLDTQPVTVQYNLTEYGWTLQDLIHGLATWGTKHRRVIMDEQSALADV